MKTYKSHKTVKAAKIIAFQATLGGAKLGLDNNDIVTVDGRWLDKHSGEHDLVGGYYVMYADGYTSWSPAEAFEQGYAELTHDPKDGALPVAGYKPQTTEKVDMVNVNKELEERTLRQLDHLQSMTYLGAKPVHVDINWLFEGRRYIELGFMMVNRAIFQPERVTLPDDGTVVDG